MRLTRVEVLRRRVHAQGLDAGRARRDHEVLDLGVQDTGPDGAAWALELRRCTIPAAEQVLVWTLRGAPHVYRRSDVAAVAAATAPWSEQDARKRTVDASRPLQAAGLTMLDGLERVRDELAAAVTAPTVKGEVSGALTERLPEPYLRHCRPCDAVHGYEQPFRLSALQAGLELEPGTSPPVLRPIPGWSGPAAKVPPRLDPVRAVLHLLGPASVAEVAAYVDTVGAQVRARWPRDAVEVDVDGRTAVALEEDLAAPTPPPQPERVRLLGPFDPYLQARDRDLLVPNAAARKDLWRVLGRPGGVLAGHELVGSWRPRSRGSRLEVAITLWDGSEPTPAMREQARRLAAWRGKELVGAG